MLRGLDYSDVAGFLALAPRSHFELNFLALVERLVTVPLDIGVVDEHIIALLTRNKAETLLGVKKLYCSCCQRFSFLLLRASLI